MEERCANSAEVHRWRRQVQSTWPEAVSLTDSQPARSWCRHNHVRHAVHAAEFLNGLFGQIARRDADNAARPNTRCRNGRHGNQQQQGQQPEGYRQLSTTN